MALTDIYFQEGEGQDFVTEIVAGTLNAPVDILFSDSSGIVTELTATTGGSSIFIMSE